MLRDIKALVQFMLLGGEIAPCPLSRCNNVYGQGGYPDDMIGSFLTNVCSPNAFEAFIWNWVWVDPAVFEIFEESGRVACQYCQRL